MPELIKTPGYKNIELKQATPRIVSMLLKDDYIYVATEYEVYKYKDGEWETILKVKDLK